SERRMSTAAIKVERMNATEAKNRFGDVLEKASAKNTAVSLMRHGKAAAYVISPEMYERLERHLRVAPGPVEKLEREFDAMLARMQARQSVAAGKSLMAIDTTDLRVSVRKPRKGAARG